MPDASPDVAAVLARRNHFTVARSGSGWIVEVRRGGRRCVAYAGPSYGEARQAAHQLAGQGLVGFAAS